ncbi:hypothetical protein M9Y10_039597, partial [Tritrichomonas musculus]
LWNNNLQMINNILHSSDSKTNPTYDKSLYNDNLSSSNKLNNQFNNIIIFDSQTSSQHLVFSNKFDQLYNNLKSSQDQISFINESISCIKYELKKLIQNSHPEYIEEINSQKERIDSIEEKINEQQQLWNNILNLTNNILQNPYPYKDNKEDLSKEIRNKFKDSEYE